MFFAQFLIGNLWNAGLICVMLGLKWLLRNRLSLRFQYYSWYLLLVSLLLSLFPVGIWPQWDFTGSAGLQAFAVSPRSRQFFPGSRSGKRLAPGYYAAASRFGQCPGRFPCSDDLGSGCSGACRGILAGKPPASDDKAVRIGTVAENPGAV